MECEPDLLYWLALSSLPCTNLKMFKKIFKYADTLKEFFSFSDQNLKVVGFSEVFIEAKKSIDWKGLEKILHWLEHPLHHILTFKNEKFPVLLKEISSAPPLLFVKGSLESLSLPKLAIVGGRKASLYGKKLATEFASEMSEQGFVVTSGLALGIDTHAHYGAILAKKPTIAVMGTGIDKVYPLQNKSLAEKILEGGGALITEFMPDEPPRAKNFPRRNRIISGLSLGVLIVEAGLKSGSLITANYAAMQGREVFAIPNAIHQTQSQGCHQLIQEGAKLVGNIKDILDELSVPLKASIPLDKNKFFVSKDVTLAKTQQKLLAFLACGFSTIEEIVRYGKISSEEVAANLAELEILGFVANTHQGYELMIHPQLDKQ